MLIILPHQLFDKKHLKFAKNEKILLWEHPQYFTKYKYNKKRLVLHFATMLYYKDYLKKAGYNVEIVKTLPSNEQLTIFDPIDKIDIPECSVIESPNFLLTKDDYAKYRKKTDKFFFNAFYMWGKKVIDVIPNVKSKDKDNRKRMPKDLEIPKLPNGTSKTNQKYITQAIKRVEKEFPDNYGSCEDFFYPITHTDAKRWLRAFINKKFAKFGDYQDFIDKDNDFLFHSVLSAVINIGLINPDDIIQEIEKHKAKIPMNSYEGYIRQLFWREYQRYCYIYFDFNGLNYFGNTGKLNKAWYDGTLGIEPVDDAIHKAFDTGYLHHIYRLMVVGNFMNLSGIDPMEGFKWFMEFSCDSYEWVMYQNVLDMVFFVSGGKTMRRPYMSSSNYVLKMSNYKKGPWAEKWTDMYHAFIKKNKDKLKRFRYFIRVK